MIERFMNKTVKPWQLIVLLVVVMCSFFVIEAHYDGRFGVVQKVVVNNPSDYDISFRFFDTSPIPPLATDNDSINKILSDAYDKGMTEYYKKRDFEDRRYTRPYKLVTKYKGMEINDFGTPSEIDSLKCLRIAEIKRRFNIKDSIEEAQNNELHRLNTPCPNK